MGNASLSERYNGYFDIGAAVNLTTIETQKDLLSSHFNSITAENDMKFERIQPEEGVYTFAAADRIVAFADRHGMKVRGHTLVWHNQTPAWVFHGTDGNPASPDLLLGRMKSHIETLTERYRGRVYAWDVVNEAIEDGLEGFLRQSKWMEGIGEDYIAEAFRIAHRSDPDALLFYNDYNECQPHKRDKIIRLVQSLQDQKVPIHGIGMQGHWNLYGPTLEQIREAIEGYVSLGVQLQITELDISMFEHDDRRTDLKEPTEGMLELQAERYEQIFGLFRKYRNAITSVTFWGAADDYTWLDDFPVRGRKNWPFVFDEKQTPKSSFNRIMENWEEMC